MFVKFVTFLRRDPAINCYFLFPRSLTSLLFDSPAGVKMNEAGISANFNFENKAKADL